MDADGVPKLGRGLDNHAVNAWGGCRYSSLHKEMLIKCTNSWGAGWGKQGHFYLPLSKIGTSAAFSAIRLISAKFDPAGRVQVPAMG